MANGGQVSDEVLQAGSKAEISCSGPLFVSSAAAARLGGPSLPDLVLESTVGPRALVSSDSRILVLEMPKIELGAF